MGRDRTVRYSQIPSSNTRSRVRPMSTKEDQGFPFERPSEQSDSSKKPQEIPVFILPEYASPSQDCFTMYSNPLVRTTASLSSPQTHNPFGLTQSILLSSPPTTPSWVHRPSSPLQANSLNPIASPSYEYERSTNPICIFPRPRSEHKENMSQNRRTRA
jgi:hypothetical protein